MQIWNNIRWLQETIYEMLKNAPDNIKQFSKGKIYNGGQCKKNKGHVQTSLADGTSR